MQEIHVITHSAIWLKRSFFLNLYKKLDILWHSRVVTGLGKKSCVVMHCDPYSTQQTIANLKSTTGTLKEDMEYVQS